MAEVSAQAATLKPVTHRRVLNVALPIVLANATVPILGAVDTGVVGQLGTAAPIGAVGLGAIILSAVYWIFGFLRMGTVGMTAQALGENNQGEVAALFTRSQIIGLSGGLLLILLQIPIIWVSFMAAPATVVSAWMTSASVGISTGSRT